jgi:hypothetical protein
VIAAELSTGTFLIALAVAVLCGYWGWRVGTSRSRPLLGLVLGAFSTIIGVGLMYLLPAKTAQT